MAAYMFPQTTEYALRIMVYLASAKDAATIAHIASASKVPASYLAKVLRLLARGGLVDSRRGLHGGSLLARPADQITIYDVIEAVGGFDRIASCPLNVADHGGSLCPLHRRVDDALALVEDACRKSTLAELLADHSGLRPLCHLDAPNKRRRKGKARRK